MDKDNSMWDLENPWIGLGTYNEGQKLYGRNNEISNLSEIILNNLATIVYGKSGIGKSSLLKAGIFPILREHSCTPIYIRLTHNSEISYSQQIQNAIIENINTSDLLPPNFPPLGLWDFFHRHEFFDIKGNKTTPVIILDQFEEIYTLTSPKHKSEVQQLFIELADVLNGIKPDNVIREETVYNQKESISSITLKSNGFSLQPISNSTLKYNKSNSFRFIITLRDDSLYLLERNSAKIPSLKVNRYNLCALDENNALDVIFKPLPGLFNESEATEILNKLAYYEFDDFKVVDPSILSLFLFSYYKEQGTVSYNDIFERYYIDSIKRINERSISYIEDQLLTERGNRKQIPLKDILAIGICFNEISSLIQSKILKTEIRKGIEYIEFSHDRLCEQALKHREDRKLREQNRLMRKRMSIAICVVLISIGFSILFGYQYSKAEKAESNLSEKNKYLEKVSDSLKQINDSLNRLNYLNNLQKTYLDSKNDSLEQLAFLNNIQKNNLDLKNDSLLSKNLKLDSVNANLTSANYIVKKQRDSIVALITDLNNYRKIVETNYNKKDSILLESKVTTKQINQIQINHKKNNETLSKIKEETLDSEQSILGIKISNPSYK